MSDEARRIAADYLASLTDAEASEFISQSRGAHEEMREFARKLFAPDQDEQTPFHNLLHRRTNR